MFKMSALNTHTSSKSCSQSQRVNGSSRENDCDTFHQGFMSATTYAITARPDILSGGIAAGMLDRSWTNGCRTRHWNCAQPQPVGGQGYVHPTYNIL